MIDSVMRDLTWAWFCKQVARKLGPDVAAEDVIDLARLLEPDEVFSVDELQKWCREEMGRG